MIYNNTSELNAGDKTGFDIVYGAKSNMGVLVRSGQILTERAIDRLQNLNVSGVYVDTPETSDIVPIELIPKDVKMQIVGRLSNVLESKEFMEGKMSAKTHKEIVDLADILIKAILASEELFVNIIMLKDGEDCPINHSVNVAILALAMGIKEGFSDYTLRDLGVGSLLHDCGKLKIDKKILEKNGKLTDEEYEIVKAHAQIGYDLIKDSHYLDGAVKAIVLDHHEKADGTGYPFGKKSKEISDLSKYVSIAEVFDAMTSRKSYREAIKPSESIEMIMGSVDTHFDMETVKVFLKCATPYPVGTKVTLSNGIECVVKKNNKDNLIRPVIKDLNCMDTFDLMNDPSLLTVSII